MNKPIEKNKSKKGQQLHPYPQQNPEPFTVHPLMGMVVSLIVSTVLTIATLLIITTIFY